MMREIATGETKPKMKRRQYEKELRKLQDDQAALEGRIFVPEKY
jgi:hypothetical protein